MKRFTVPALVLLGALAGPAQAAAPARTVTIGLGYVPNVQFTPFYVADRLGTSGPRG